MNEFIFDLQRFSNLGTLKTLGGIIKTLGLVKLAQDLDNAKDASKYLKENANPILKFIGSTPFGKKFSSYATLITSTISIVDNALSVLTDNTLSDAERSSKIGAISGSLVAMANATNKLDNSFKKKNLWFLSILSSGISLTANLITASDGMKLEEKKKINNSYVALLKSLGSDLVKEIFDSAVEKQLSRAFTEDLTTDLVEEIMTKNKFFQNASKTLTKTFGVVLSLATGALNAIDEYNDRMKKYTEDGIPEDIAKHDAFIDAFATFVHDNLSAYFKGVDNWVFEFMLGVVGEETDKNYIEVIADRFKILNYMNTGSSEKDSIFLSTYDKSYVYGDSGNDSILNVASDVSIWGGHDNDTIWSIKTDTITPTHNSILGGPGNDLIFVQDTQSTIYGGNGTDSLGVQGTKNLLYGDAGNDFIILADCATGNSINGGAGDDLIIINSAANKNKFFYATGDGNDTISGFSANDSLTISGTFSTVKNGSNIKVKVGNGSILLLDAADKKIYINGNVYNDNPDSSGTFTPIEIPYLSVPESPLISGTSGNDRIYNDRSNVLIKTGKGDDYIDNTGSNVTIDGGDDDDYISNIADNVSINAGAGYDTISNIARFVTINAGDGNNYIYIYNSGESVTIDSGDGNDYIWNGADNVTISSGKGNDSIHNTLYGYSVTINAGAGNDSVYNEGSDATDIKINGEAGSDTIISESENTTIIGGDDNDYIYNEGDYVTIDGSEGNDDIYSSGVNVIINGGNGNDTIENRGYDVKINAGTGNDSIWTDVLVSYGSNNYRSATVDGGEGNDTIQVRDHQTSLNGGAGNDLISVYSSDWENNTLQGGKGNDVIYGGSSNIFVYSDGDGNDTVFNFNSDDTLQIGGGTGSYFSKTSGNDVIVTVGTGKITLVGATSLSKVNIDGVEKNSWKINGNTATYGNLITISGVASGATDANFYIKGNTVTIGKAAVQTNGTPAKLLNQSGYTLKLGKGMIESTNVATAYDAKTMTYDGWKDRRLFPQLQ